MAEAIAAECSAKEREDFVRGYLEIGAFLDGGLRTQAELDADSFTKATGRSLSAAECDMFVAATHQALRWTFIGSGMSHANFLATADRVHPGAAAQLKTVVPAFC